MNTTLGTHDGHTLEAIVDEPDSPIGSIVVCHPHPLHGGTMRAPLLISIRDAAVDAGYRVARFNFRYERLATDVIAGFGN